MKCLLSFFLALSTLTFAEKLSIKLDTQSRLIPTALSRIEIKNDAQIHGAYEKKLERTLHFDLYHMGQLMLVDPKTDVKIRVSSAGDVYPLASNEKAAPQIRLRPYIHNGTLTLECSGFGETRAYSAPLSGILGNDRMRIHQICDKLHEVLFGMKSVASHRIAYTLKVKDPSHPRGYRAEIWESDWDGSNAKRLSSVKDFSLTPSYIKSHTPKLFYVNYRTGQAKIHMLNLAEKTSRPFLSMRGNQMLPSVSLNNDYLAFVCDAVGSSDLFILDLNAKSKPARFSFAPGVTHASPTFSPQSDKIAFVCDKTGQPQIYIADVDFKSRVRLERLTQKNRQNTCPRWSPDGTKLVYVGLTDGVRQLWLYDFKTGVEKQLTFDPINKECPTWAPSSAHIAYNTAENAELYVLTLSRGESVRISREGGEKKFPSWQP